VLRKLVARWRQGYRTAPYPSPNPNLPPSFLGRPILDAERCISGCRQCVDACPTDALRVTMHGPELDLGRCIFCGDCVAKCPNGAIAFTSDWRLSSSSREGLLLTGDSALRVDALAADLRRLLGRSLRLREVSAGGCSGCDAEVNALGNVVFDSSRFGIDLVASPRHADGILVTGPITANMKTALLKTYEAVAEPKLVIAVGACAISGGIHRDNKEVCNGLEGLLAIDLYVPGCPPHPVTILDGILRLLGRCPETARASGTKI
jgi:Ni,Fe-hydrogenase III small subunit/NAD-dependent dihydropyrimidine dehydrogenase PreA subunit